MCILDIPDPWFTGNKLSAGTSPLPTTPGNKNIKTDAIGREKYNIVCKIFLCYGCLMFLCYGPEMGTVSMWKWANTRHTF